MAHLIKYKLVIGTSPTSNKFIFCKNLLTLNTFPSRRKFIERREMFFSKTQTHDKS